MQLQTLSLAPILGNNDFILPDKYLFLSLSEDGEKDQRKTDPIRGHSTTTWTKFDPILTPSPLEGSGSYPLSRDPPALCVEMGFYTDISWESRRNIEINI